MTLTDYDLMAWAKNASRDIAEMAQTLLAYRSIPEIKEVDVLVDKIYANIIETKSDDDGIAELADLARRAIISTKSDL